MKAFALTLSHIANGAALGIAVSGALVGFIFFHNYSFLTGVIAAFFGLLPGIFFYLVASILLFIEKLHRSILDQANTINELSKEIQRLKNSE